MDINGVFEILEGDASTVLARFAGNEGLWKRFAKKFSEDETFQKLIAGIEMNDNNGIEMYAHTLKGVAANLGFEKLSNDAAAIVNAVRNEKFETIPELFDELNSEYNKVLDCVGSLD